MRGPAKGFASIPEAKLQKDAANEIRNIQENFAVARSIGIWDSPYPQIAFSSLLGCAVREVQAKDMVR